MNIEHTCFRDIFKNSWTKKKNVITEMENKNKIIINLQQAVHPRMLI